MIKLEARTRLGAQELHDQLISNSAGMSHCKRYTKAFAKYRKQFQSLGAKGGLELFLYKDTPFKTMVLVSGAEVVAYLELNKAGDSDNATWYSDLLSYYIVAELFIAPKFRGLKLATVLHLGAAHAVKKLVSDINMAEAALHSFKSLEKYGYKMGLYNGSKSKKVAFTWGSDGVPVVGGQSIEDLDDNFVLYTK